MRKWFFIGCLTTLPLWAIAQSAPAAYYIHARRADSLFASGAYRLAGSSWSAAFETFGGKGYVDDRYNAACAWALAGEPDSAFLNLERIASRAIYADLEKLQGDKSLAALHSDSRWKPLIEVVSANYQKYEAGHNMSLIHLLDSLQRADQQWRNYMTQHNNKELGKSDTLTTADIAARVIAADSLHYLLLKDIFARYGFPGYDLVGERGASAFWLLVQHQDNHPSFQDSVLQRMKLQVDKKNASYNNYAYLTDRVKVNTGQLQVYGTQMMLNADSTSYVPKPVIDPAGLNERRSEAGLGTIEEYIGAMNNKYYGTLRKRRP